MRDVFGLDELPSLVPHYNIAPSQPLAVIRTPGKLERLRWGLVPFWADDVKIGHKLALARAESITSTPAFRDAVRRRRCLIVVSGFYEWRRAGKSSAPFFVRRADTQPFAIAGVWDRWVSKDGEVVESCAVVTRPATPPLDAVHDRMPLVLQPDAWSRWLDSRRSPEAMRRATAPDLVVLPVTPYVNDPKHDDPECLRAAGAPQQGTLFD